jgi:lysozyme
VTPGDKTPGRYKLRSKLSAAVLALVAAGAAAPTIYHQFLDEREGSRQVAYLDGAGIWTICRGLTRIYDRPVTKADRLSVAECDKLDGQEQARGLAEMQALVKPEVWASMPPAAQAGVASFCVHNIGAAKCQTSTFLRLLNEGRRNEACGEITRWIRDGGKDCRVRTNGCFGQVDRRMAEDELCLRGVE